MYIAVLADNIADRKQTERLLGRANDALSQETGTLYVSSYGDAESLLRAPMKYELFLIDMYDTEDHGQSVIDELKKVGAPGKIIMIHPEDVPFSYKDAINGISGLKKPLIVSTLHQAIRDAHKEHMQAVIPKVEVRSESQTHYIPLDQIVYADEVNHTVSVHLEDGSVVSMVGEIYDFYRWVNNHKEFLPIKKDTVINKNHVLSSTKRSYHMSNGDTINTSLLSLFKQPQ